MKETKGRIIDTTKVTILLPELQMYMKMSVAVVCSLQLGWITSLAGIVAL